jgi:signal transduction histidine kinase
MYGFQSYISVPIVLPDGEMFGTLCAIDKAPASLRGSTALETFRLFADLIGRYLHDEKRLEQTLHEKEEIQRLLQQSQKMEVVGQLTAGLAHDFNNMLVGISGAFNMMRRRLAQGRSEDLAKFLTIGQDSTGRAIALAARLLAFSRRQDAVAQPHDITPLIEGLVELVRRTVGRRISVVTKLSPVAWKALIDANQFESAVLNLCVNARDAMPDQGTLTLETENQYVSHGAAGRLQLRNGDYVVMRVTDTGVGMSPELASRVLEPFFTTKPVGTGTGLGLAMVFEFTRQAGGALCIESELGRGTTIALYLPRIDEAS